MKRKIYILAVMTAVVLAAVSCIKKTDIPGDDDSNAQGTFKLSGLVFSKAVEIIHKTRADVDTDNYTVCITQTSNGEEHLSCNFCDMPGTVTLPIGEHKITIESHEVKDAEWGRPYYAATHFFEIEKGGTTEVNDLVCKLANIMTSVSFTPEMLALMDDDGVVSLRIGSAWLHYGMKTERTDDPYNSENYRYYDGNSGFFKAPADENVLLWMFGGNIKGEDGEYEFVDDEGAIPAAKAGEHRKLTFDLNRTPVPTEEGGVNFIFSVQVTVETIDLNLNVPVKEEIIEPLVPAVEITSEKYSLTERHTMTYSKCIEDGSLLIDDLAVDLGADAGLTNVFIGITTDNENLKAALAGYGLDATFDLVNPGEELVAILTSMGLPTGAEVKSKTSVNLNFSGMLPYIFGFGDAGVFDIRITAYDWDMEVAGKTLRLKLFDDSVSRPIVIEWVDYDINERYTFKRSEVIDKDGNCIVPVALKVTADSGITKFMVAIKSNILGLDKTSLISFGLDDEFDLVDPHDVPGRDEGELEKSLLGLGFPVRDQVKDATTLGFDITQFIPLIFVLEGDGYADFQLEVTDNEGNIETKTIQINILYTE